MNRRRSHGGAFLPPLCALVGRHTGLYHRCLYVFHRRSLRRHVPHGLWIRRYVLVLSHVQASPCMRSHAANWSGFALTLVWVSNVVPRPPAKRSAAIGIVNGFGNLGNLCVLPQCRITRCLKLVCNPGSVRTFGRPLGARTTISLWSSASPDSP